MMRVSLLHTQGPPVVARSYHRQERGSGWRARLLVDEANDRLKVKAYRFTDPAPFCHRLWELARQLGMGKVIVEARQADWEALLEHGFRMEAIIDGYFQGEPAYCMSYFLQPGRQQMGRLEEKQRILESVLAQELQEPPLLPPGYRLQRADESMAPAMAAVFDHVFTSYPSPLTDPAYLRELMASREGIFYVVKDGDQIVSAAGAEVDWEQGHAEMTNCATLPDYRGEGLMSIILAALEEEMADAGIGCLFSLARSLSFGMNCVLRRAGYRFRGRMLNNCHIMGGYECMNLWVKAGVPV